MASFLWLLGSLSVRLSRDCWNELALELNFACRWVTAFWILSWGRFAILQLNPAGFGMALLLGNAQKLLKEPKVLKTSFLCCVQFEPQFELRQGAQGTWLEVWTSQEQTAF